MPKQSKSKYICSSCGYISINWQGQCPECNQWNTLEESVSAPTTASNARRSTGVVHTITPLSSVKLSEYARISTNIVEFDRVLGGGFVPGQVILLAGEPGIGKSTILTQIAKSMTSSKVLYVCGEESPSQVKIRASRMEYTADNLFVLSETVSEDICSTIESSSGLGLIIVDSVQTLTSNLLTGAPGTVGQVKETAHQLSSVAKKLNIPMILVGHVTKDGTLAGPKVLEHLVDTILYLEGDSQHMYRMLKTTKNRFGSVSEIGVFEMHGVGLKEVTNPSEIFLSTRLDSASGSCITVIMEGMRPILFEVQALVTQTTFGYPRRTASGFNANRLNVLIAIIEKRCNLNLSNHDVFVNIAGGYKVSEYAADLAVCIAIASSLKNVAVSPNVAVFGEVGLSGEIRKVTHEDRRRKEAKKLGFDVIISSSNKTLRSALNSALPK